MPVTAADIQFDVAEVRPGRKLSWIQASSWTIGAFPQATTVPLPAHLGLNITAPRPISERTGRLHTPWDKWLTGEQWGGKGGMTVCAMFGEWPYTMELTGDLTNSDVTINHRDMTITKTFTAAGTYNFRITVFDNKYKSDYVDVSLTVHDAAAGNILDHFRVVDFDAAIDGVGTAASPFNTWASFWGTDWNVQISPTIIGIMKGTRTITNLSLANEAGVLAWDLGTNRPRCLIGTPTSNVTFDLTTAVKHVNVRQEVESDIWLKGMTFSGIRGSGASMIRQANFDERVHYHDLTFRDARIQDTANDNNGCIGGSGVAAQKQYTSFVRITFQDIDGSGLNTTLVNIFDSDDILFDDITIIRPGVNFALGNGLRCKHGSARVEFRRVIDDNAGTDPYVYAGTMTMAAGGGNSQNVLMRHNFCRHLAPGAGVAPDVIINLYWLMYNNTFACDMQMGINVLPGSTGHWSRNIMQNSRSATQGFGTIDADWGPIPGEANLREDNLYATSGLIDANGEPILEAHEGYGHSLAYLDP